MTGVRHIIALRQASKRIKVMGPRSGRHKVLGGYALLGLGMGLVALAFCRRDTPDSAFLLATPAVPLVAQPGGAGLLSSPAQAAVQSSLDSNYKAPPFLSHSALCAMSSSALLVAILAASSKSSSKGSSSASRVGRKAVSVQISVQQRHRLPAAQSAPKTKIAERACASTDPKPCCCCSAYPCECQKSLSSPAACNADLLTLAPLTPAMVPSTIASATFIPKEAEGQPQPAIGRTTRHVCPTRAARRVGGARYGCRRTGRQASAHPDASARRQRRAAGSGLLGRPTAEPQSMSFDASRIRSKLQLSLRSACSVQRKQSRSREPCTLTSYEATGSNELLSANYSGEVTKCHGSN